MFGQVGVIDWPEGKSGFLYSMDFKDRDNKPSSWMTTPALCTERCRMVNQAKYSIVKMGNRNDAPYCACAKHNFQFEASKGFILNSKNWYRWMVLSFHWSIV